MHRQCPVKTLALDARSRGDFRDALSLDEVAQGEEQNAGSSSSSNAALRYSAVKSGSFRGRRMMASSARYELDGHTLSPIDSIALIAMRLPKASAAGVSCTDS